MMKLKRKKWILFATSLTLSMSVFLAHAYPSTQIANTKNVLDKEKKENKTMIASSKEDSIHSTPAGSEEDLKLELADKSSDNEKISYVSYKTTPEISRGGERELPSQVAPAVPVQNKSTAPSQTKPTPLTQATPMVPARQKPVQPASTNVTNDLDLLARLIMAEAQGESYDAKVAVGAVVMNRVKSGSFPNSISGVIYQKINGYYQFTPVVNGWINKPANSESINAAKAALSGTDPTKGALFYYDNKTTNPWMLSKPVSVTIGNMIFAY